MMVSNDLKEALKRQRASREAGYSIKFVESVAKTIPRIEALERLLKDREWILHYDEVMRTNRWWWDKCQNERQERHAPSCEIAIALKESKS